MSMEGIILGLRDVSQSFCLISSRSFFIHRNQQDSFVPSLGFSFQGCIFSLSCFLVSINASMGRHLNQLYIFNIFVYMFNPLWELFSSCQDDSSKVVTYSLSWSPNYLCDFNHYNCTSRLYLCVFVQHMIRLHPSEYRDMSVNFGLSKSHLKTLFCNLAPAVIITQYRLHFFNYRIFYKLKIKFKFN
jgi:hypothetical protein